MVKLSKKLTHAQKLGLALGGDVDRAYHEALGRFMDEFSQIEALLHLFLLLELELDVSLGACVLSGVRPHEAIASLRRIHETKAKVIAPEVEDAFQHIGTMTTARNDIIHYGADGDGSFERTVSTALKAHTEKKAKTWKVSADTLVDMYLDANKAMHILLKYLVTAWVKDLWAGPEFDAALVIWN